MKRSVFYKWMIEGDPAGAGAPAAPSSPAPADGGGSLDDLEIEKTWLQLAEVDPDRFGAFYDKYHDRIFAYAFWKTGDHDRAADVVAETFLTAWEKRGRFRWQGYSFGAWLFQIARGVISHRHRRDQRRREVEFDAARHDPVDNQTPADTLALKTDNELVNRCLERLPEGQHDVIVLHHFVGLSVRQIALVTRTPQGTVNSHLRRGKQSLRQCLIEHGPAQGLSEGPQRILRQAAAEETGLRVIDEKAGGK